ncbi:hypothetical protein ACFE04_014794 [Oxalis oulophora]
MPKSPPHESTTTITSKPIAILFPLHCKRLFPERSCSITLTSGVASVKCSGVDGDDHALDLSCRKQRSLQMIGIDNDGETDQAKATASRNLIKLQASTSGGKYTWFAYSRHIVQLYSYHGNDDVHNHLEIDAHVGGVNDLAFSHSSKQLCLITCGDDKTIKVWDVATGSKQYTFEGHEAPDYSFIFSTALDGKIKAWLYDNRGSRVDYDAPSRWCTTMAYSADGTRLFSCGTSKEGESYIVEWNESEGAASRRLTTVSFSTT